MTKVMRWSIALGLALGTVGAASAAEIEGDPSEGRVLFVDKHCVQCHAVWGQGGTLGPEIVKVVAKKSLPELAGAFWNHTPRMIEEMAGRGYAWPTIERQEMADILSYLYYIRLFDDPGDPVRGYAAFTRLRCSACHSLGGEGGDTASALDAFSDYTSPVPLAQAMWNAGPSMHPSQLGRGVPIPEFSRDEMVDIQAFIRERGLRRKDSDVVLLPLPDTANGERLFRSKGCAKCHDTGSTGAPDLGTAALRMTVAEICGILWNHSYAMQGQMRAAGLRFPRFSGNELADVIAYLHLLGYRGEEGTPARGSVVFREKGCAVCHEQQRGEAPDLATLHADDDAIGLSAAMWNHAPEMHEVMADYGMPWPKFDEGDMEDLVAFLREFALDSSSSKER